MSYKNIPNVLPDACHMKECSDIKVKTKVLNTEVDAEKKHGKKITKKLGEVEISGVIIDDSHIPEGYVEIKGIEKTPIITQCKIVGGTIIVEGYIIKNIKYATPIDISIDTGKCKSYRNHLNDIIIKVPFSFAGPIGCIELKEYPDSIKSKKYNYLQNSMKPCDKGHMGPALCEWEEVDYAELYRPPYCELIKWKIREYDVCRNCDEYCNETNLYNVFTEKMVLILKFEVFQDVVEEKHPHQGCSH